MSATYTLTFQSRRLRRPQRRLKRLLGQARPEFLEHRLALYNEEQRMVFGPSKFREFVRVMSPGAAESEVADSWAVQMRTLPTTVVSTRLQGPFDWPDVKVVRGGGDFDLELVEGRTFDGHTQKLICRPTLHA